MIIENILFGIDVSILSGFLMTCIVIELTPGPNMGYLALLSATEGRRKGFLVTLGIALGLLTIGMIAATGLAIIITKSTLLYEMLRWSGVAYLLWLAYESWQTPKEMSPVSMPDRKTALRYFTRGLITNLLNPKAALFYIAVLPRFTSPDQNALPQIILLTLLYVVIATLIHITIVILAGTARPFLSSPARQSLIRKIFAILLVGIAMWFGLSTMR